MDERSRMTDEERRVWKMGFIILFIVLFIILALSIFNNCCDLIKMFGEK